MKKAGKGNSYFSNDALTVRTATREWVDGHFDLERMVKEEADGKLREQDIKDGHRQYYTRLMVDADLDTTSALMVAAELMRHPSLGIRLVSPGLAAAAIKRGGSEEQQQDLARAMDNNDGMPAGLAFGLTEPNVGSDAFNITTKAVYDPQKQTWTITGEKAYITGAQSVKDAGENGFAVILAQTEVMGQKMGPAAFIVKGDNPQYSVGPQYDKAGLHGSDTAPINLDNCVVSADAMLGWHIIKEYNFQRSGYAKVKKVMKATLETTRPYVAALALGIAQAAYDRALKFASDAMERRIDGKALTQFETMRHKLAEIRAEIEAVGQLVYSTGPKLDKILAGEKDGFDVEEGSMAKWMAADLAVRVTRASSEILGGLGYMNESGAPVYRHAAEVFTVWEGTEPIQLETISKVLTREQEVQSQGETTGKTYQITGITLDENVIPQHNDAKGYFQLMRTAIIVYNLALESAVNLNVFDREDVTVGKDKTIRRLKADGQSTRHNLARMRSKIQAGLEVGRYAVATEDDDHIAMATWYARSITNEIIINAGEICSESRDQGALSRVLDGHRGIVNNGTKTRKELLDDIAGTMDNFKLQPSARFYN